MEPMLSTIPRSKPCSLKDRAQGLLTLSHFFPKGTEYFYSFPSGENSYFYNNASPYTEELVAARALACAGKDIKVISFSATTNPAVKELRYRLGMSSVDDANILSLPSKISAQALGRNRNRLVKKALQEIATPASLIMAQPFSDAALADIYQLPPNLTIWLNDKKNISTYTPAEYVPRRIATFQNGLIFKAHELALPIPCVIKVSSSSAGDGVCVCRNSADILHAKAKFGTIKGTIIVEQYIEARRNFCVQFGIPHSYSAPIEIIGCSEQLTTPSGEFLGGIVHPNRFDPDAQEISKIVLEKILPKIQRLGWYGVGGLDALLGTDGHFYIIDSNFRMTSTIAYLFHVRCSLLKQPCITFTGSFKGDIATFQRIILPVAKSTSADQRMHTIALSYNEGVFRFNASLLFDEPKSISKRAAYLLSLGIQSHVLELLSKHGESNL